MAAISRKIAVPGATLYAEMRGDGPLLLMIPGGPADAGVFSALASELSDRYKVVSFDPRGNSRSHFDHEPLDLDMNVMGNDAAVVIAAYGGEAFVFGTSGGAQIALNLTARYPQLVRALVAHEPPCARLLPEHGEIQLQMNDIVRIFHEKGAREGWAAFNRVAWMQPSIKPTSPPSPDALATAERIRRNFDYFLGHAASAIADYLPELDRLRASKVPISVGYGLESLGELANRAALALGEQLPAPTIGFPGGHGGFGTAPQDFASTLHQAFNA